MVVLPGREASCDEFQAIRRGVLSDKVFLSDLSGLIP